MGIYIKGVDFYPAIVRKVDGIFAAQVVDIPQCCALGATPIDAELKAMRSLDDYLDGAQDLGAPVPRPSVRVDIGNVTDRYVTYIRRHPPKPRND